MKDGREGQIKGEKRGEEGKGRGKLAPKPKKNKLRPWLRSLDVGTGI